MKRIGQGLLLLGLAVASAPAAQNTVQVEGSYVTPASIDVAIPGDSGTRFSLTDDLSADPAVSGRLRYGRVFGWKHWVGVLWAPLTVEAEGAMDRPVSFNGLDFPAGTPLKATYRFDSYRVSYRYLLRSSGPAPFLSAGRGAARSGGAESLRDGILRPGSSGGWQIWFGGALKVRDAAIRLEDGTLRTEKDNTGLVPLLSFQARWSPARSWSFLFEGEGLVSSQGRAEDILLAVQRDFGRKVSVYAGYRLLEGGADNDEVTTFALFHGLVAGAAVRF